LRTDDDTHSRWSVAGGEAVLDACDRPTCSGRSWRAPRGGVRRSWLIRDIRTSLDHAERHMNWLVLARGVRRGAFSGVLRWVDRFLP
jgi:hypothetical protein